MGIKLFNRGDTPRTQSVDSMGRRPSAVDAMANSRRRASVDDHAVTGAGEITTRQSIIPVSLVTILFFMWGFAYGLLDVLNKHFQETLHIGRAQSAWLQIAYFGAYLLMSLPAGSLMHARGYKFGLITGLVVTAAGAFLFVPAAQVESFPFFVASMF